MSRSPKFAIKHTPDGWRVNVPSSVSSTGKRQMRFFPTRRKAEDFASDLRTSYADHGRGTSIIPPDIAAEALRAHSLLEPYGITIMQAAMRAVKEADVVARSIPSGEAMDAWLTSIQGLRPKTKKSYKETIAKLRPKLGEKTLATVTALEVQSAIEGGSYDLHRRNAGAFWRWSAKAPRRWCDAAVFKDLEAAAKGGDEAEISVMKPDRAEKLLRTAEKYYPETVCIYVAGFFGGVRAEERDRLEAEDFGEEGIELGAKVAKKRRRRHIPMNDTLAAWLEAYPFKPCPNWADKDKAVRRLAGWDVEARLLDKPPVPTFGRWPKNVIRHTHASAEIANGATLEDLLFRFGHTDSPDVLRSHYVGRYTKKDAVAFFSVGPRGSKVQLIKSA